MASGTSTLDRFVEQTPGMAGGKPRVAGHRITVQDIAIWHERFGRGADEIAAEHDLTLVEVYAALAYYFDHRPEIDAQIAADASFVKALRQSSPSRLPEKLRGSGDPTLPG
jgi:uncharacterized protein (DUF433 family)